MGTCVVTRFRLREGGAFFQEIKTLLSDLISNVHELGDS